MSFGEQVSDVLVRWGDQINTGTTTVAIARGADVHMALVSHLVARSGEPLQDVFTRLKDLLIRKNIAYGNSALHPVRIFSAADTSEQLRVRLDDKLARLERGGDFDHEDVVLDLLGYLVILEIAESLADTPEVLA